MEPTVIVVDDDHSLAELVCDVLNEKAIPAEFCPYGYGAHACIREKQPKAVVLDIQMPLVDGIQLFTSLKADPATATIPVIFFTANEHWLLDRYPNFKDLDVPVVSKPFDIKQFVGIVSQTLAQYDTNQ